MMAIRIRKSGPGNSGLFAILGLVALAVLAAAAQAKVIHHIPGYTVTYPRGKIGGSSAVGLPAPFVSVPPAGEYYLDYQVRFESDFQWVKGGKLPGLVGGSRTTGCTDVGPNGWSARFMWHEQGETHLYLYHQKRRSGCGDTYRASAPAALPKNQWNRITQRVVLNAPGADNGLVEAWYNGRKVLSQGNLQLRGRVGETVARIDAISLQTFYGGSSSSWAPSQDTHATFGGFYLMDSLPDFSRPFGSQGLGTRVLFAPRRNPAPTAGLSHDGSYLFPGSAVDRTMGILGFDARGRVRATLQP
jgi:hypothetical protein